MSARRPIRVTAWLLGILLVLGAGGYAAYYYGYVDRYLCEGTSCATQAALPPKDLSLPAADPALPVLAAPADPAVDAARMRAAVLPVLQTKALGKHVGFAVGDLSSGRTIWSYGSGSFVPASTLKLFTSVTALRLVGARTRFTTKVTRTGDDVTLVGGGDPYLTLRSSAAARAAYPARASLSDLANQTATALAKTGTTRVRLGFDDTLFTGPAVSPQWPSTYISTFVTTPVSALWVDQGVIGYRRTPTPALAAAQSFAKLLQKRGIAVTGRPVRRAAGTQQQVAAVQSGTLAQIVQSLLEHSDNQAAEVVLRHAAIAAGEPATFAGGTAAVQRTLTSLGVPWAGNQIHDGSGLARTDRVSVASMLAVLQHAQGMLADLPVAGFNGSLTSRFTSPAAGAGLGVVRAKTGTLTGVHALAGTAVDASGTSLAFVVMVDRVKVPQTLAARAALDRVTATVAACACSR